MQAKDIHSVPSEVDAAWAAGLFEGEGCVYAHTICPSGRGVYTYATFSLGMTDEDVVRRFHAVVGVGTVIGPRRRVTPDGRPQKDSWEWQCSSRGGALHLASLFKPFLGNRRIAQLERALAADTRGLLHESLF